MLGKFWLLASAAAILTGTSTAYADPIYDKPEVSFSCILGDCSTNLTGQLKLQVIGDTTGSDPNVYFKFLNLVGIQSSIVMVSFQGLSGLNFLHPQGSHTPPRAAIPGVEFQLATHDGGIPDALPTGSTPFTASYTAQAVFQGFGGVLNGVAFPGLSGLINNGVNGADEAFELTAANPAPGYLSFLHDIQSGKIRVGIDVIGLPGGGEATYLSAVPEPETAVMLLAGLIGLAAWAKRRRA